jgi:hypothetical protein
MRQHGTRSCYNSGCKCEACTEANSSASRARRDRIAGTSRAPQTKVIAPRREPGPSSPRWPIEPLIPVEGAPARAATAATGRAWTPAASPLRSPIRRGPSVIATERTGLAFDVPRLPPDPLPLDPPPRLPLARRGVVLPPGLGVFASAPTNPAQLPAWRPTPSKASPGLLQAWRHRQRVPKGSR